MNAKRITISISLLMFPWFPGYPAANAGGDPQCAGQQPGTPCTDTDENECTFAECRFDGFCDQTRPRANFVPCADTDGNECTLAECDGAGACDQLDTCTDTTPPNITCPFDAQVFCGESTDAGEPTAPDDCDLDPTIDHSDVVTPSSDPADPVLERIERTWTATNDCGLSSECTQTITVLKVEAFLDIKPGSCPNPVEPRARGSIPMSLPGTADFDVMTVDPTSLRLSRADGIGGAVAPTSWSLQDTGTPFTGPLCGCHRLGRDGFPDLWLKFDNVTVGSELQLSTLVPNASVELVLGGTLSDGCDFIAADCMVRTPVKGR